MDRIDTRTSVVLAGALVLWAGLVARFWWIADDAWITWRYSRNWALGRGILFNVGEPPVEGYSNFLWMALGAAVERVGLPVATVSPLGSVICGGLLLAWVARTLVLHLEVPPIAASVAVLALGASPAVALWSTSGLETIPFALLLFVTFERLVFARAPVGAVIAGILLCLVRTEGPAWAAVIAVLGAGSAAVERRSLRPVATFALALTVLYTPYFAWRYHHFGTWVSNTTLAKVGFGAYAFRQGGDYLISFWLALIGPLGWLLALPVARRRPAILGPVALLAVGVPLYAVVVGGDYLPMGRLLVPGLPFAVLLAGVAMVDAHGRPRPAALAALLALTAVGLLPGFDVNPVPHGVRAAFHFRDNKKNLRSEYVKWRALNQRTAKWVRLGVAMKQVAEPPDTWVTGGIGAVGYFSDVFLYDVGGLVNREVASRPWSDREAKSRSPGHEKTVPNAFFLDRAPTFIKAELIEGDGWRLDIPREIDGWRVTPEVAEAYYPDFREVAPWLGRRQFVVMLRRAGPKDDAAERWEDLDDRLSAHLHGRGDAPEGGDAELAALEAIGYVEGDVPADGRASGVTVHTPRTAPGMNLLLSGHGPEAVLLDADGKVRHRWTRTFRQVWPDEVALEGNRGTRYWRTGRLRDDGSVVAVFEGHGIFAVGRDGTLLWAVRNNAHHDIELLPNGDLWVPVREARRGPTGEAYLEDSLALLGPDGVEKQRISVLAALQNSPWAHFATRRRHGDLLHTNAVEVLDDRLARHGDAFRPGHLLLSMRVIDTVAVLDPQTGRITWAKQGPWKGQHDPHAVDGGRILVFDNLGANGRSRMLELDPGTGEIGWEYRNTKDHPFFSRTCGSAARLPNGNTLVSETMNGRAFELAPDGDVVWEYLSPFRVGSEGDVIARIFELHRVPVPAWLPAD